MKALLKAVLLLSAFLLIQSGNTSQAQKTSVGSLKGIVVDKNEARVLNTKIIIANKRFHKELRVDDEGEFNLELPIGKYYITARVEGFYKYRSSVRIIADKQTEIKIKLKVIPTRKIKCPPGSLCL